MGVFHPIELADLKMGAYQHSRSVQVVSRQDSQVEKITGIHNCHKRPRSRAEGEIILNRARDENLMIVAAVEGYSFKHDIEEKNAFDLFKQYGVFDLIRSQYDTLHTQSLDESVSFAEDIILSRTNR